jgi:hypothetical protein
MANLGSAGGAVTNLGLLIMDLTKKEATTLAMSAIAAALVLE